MIRRPPRSTLSSSSAASDVYKRQASGGGMRRNDITKAVGGGMFAIAMATCSGLAAAQDTTASPKRVGFLSGFGCSTDANPSPFRRRLAELGWVDGQTVILD